MITPSFGWWRSWISIAALLFAATSSLAQLVVSTTAECATSADGSVVGTLNPLTPPIVSPVFSGTLSSGTYYIEFAWYDAASHVTLPSPEVQQQLSSTGALQISPPSGLPATASGMQVFIGTSSGTETLQGSTSGSAVFTQSTALTAGTALPSSNSTVCQVIANDAGWPTGTGYDVSMTTPAGDTYPGYPMRAQFLGPGNTINLGTGFPAYNGVVQYPSPIVATPYGHGPQSISGPLSLGGYGLTAKSVNGVLSSTAFSTLVSAIAACANPGTLLVSTSLTATTTMSIPSSCGLQFITGGSLNISSGAVVTIGGPISGPATQLFYGSGTVDGLSTVEPEWFGANVISAAVQSACASKGCVIPLQNATYSSSFAISGNCWTQSNVWFEGTLQPVANSSYSGLTGGTIIQGGLGIGGANGIHVSNLGIDNGSAFAGTSTNDGLVVTGVTGCSGSSPSDPLVTGTRIENVTSILSSGAVAFHAIRVEHNTGAILRNLTEYFGVHGVALKSVNSSLIGLQGYGNGQDCLIVKADSYTPTGNILSSDIQCFTINASNVLLAGVILDSENAQPLNVVTLSNVQIHNAQFGIRIVSDGSAGAGSINAVDISNLLYIYDVDYGLSPEVWCLLSTGVGSNTATSVHIEGSTCINKVAGTPFSPVEFDLPMNNSTLSDTLTSGSNSNGSTIEGSPLYINDFTETNVSSNKPFYVTNNATAYISNYRGISQLVNSTVDSGSFLYAGTYVNPTVISTVSTATALTGTGPQPGLLTIRDQTSGGSALFLVDPNAGSQLIGTSQITGLTSASQVTFASGVWKVSLSSGTFPRTLVWSILF